MSQGSFLHSDRLTILGPSNTPCRARARPRVLVRKLSTRKDPHQRDHHGRPLSPGIEKRSSTCAGVTARRSDLQSGQRQGMSHRRRDDGFAPVGPSLDSQWIAVWKAAIVTKLDEKKHYPEAAVANRDM